MTSIHQLYSLEPGAKNRSRIDRGWSSSKADGGGGDREGWHRGGGGGWGVDGQDTEAGACVSNEARSDPPALLNDCHSCKINKLLQDEKEKRGVFSVAHSAGLRAAMLPIDKENEWCALQRQTAVTAYLKSKQLLLFVFASGRSCLAGSVEQPLVTMRRPSRIT